MSFSSRQRVGRRGFLLGTGAGVAATLLCPREAWADRLARVTEVSLGQGSPSPAGSTGAGLLRAASSATVALPHPATHVGVRWTGEGTALLQARHRRPGGLWSPWITLEPSPDLEDPARGMHSSGLLRADGAREVEVRAVSGGARDLMVVGLDAGSGPASAPAEHDQPAEAPPPLAQPPVVGRRAWGADEGMRRGSPSFALATRIAIHHTVTPNDDPDPAATIRAIYAYHTQSHGWEDIAYNFLVDGEGRIYEGRFARPYDDGEAPTGEDRDRRLVVGAHTSNNNPGTIGVALLGTFTDTPPTPAALQSLRAFLAWEVDRQGIDAQGQTTWSSGTRPTIVGHRDAGRTACPGEQMYGLLPSVRQDVTNAVARAHSPVLARGYWTLARDGQVEPFGEAGAPLAGAAASLVAPARAVAATPSGRGYWVMSSDGRVTTFGDARPFGSLEGERLNAPLVALEPSPSGLGYWLLGGDGGVFAFGDAAFLGAPTGGALRGPAVGLAATPSGRGYWVAAADGGVFAFGDARFRGSAADRPGASAIAFAVAPSGAGYWLLRQSGEVVALGDARYYGDLQGLRLPTPTSAVRIRSTPSGLGYYVLSADGGVFAFGDARFLGSSSGRTEANPAVDLWVQPVVAGDAPAAAEGQTDGAPSGGSG